MAREPSKAGALAEGKSQRVLPMPPEVQSNHHLKPNSIFLLVLKECTVYPGVSASRKYASEIHSVMMTGALCEKFPNLAPHIGAYV